MERKAVVSRKIRSIGYENGTLEIEFNTSAIYHYFSIPENIFTELMNAPSKGKYFRQVIKPNYSYVKVG
jgi:hypothetical protein